jgi:hypothetical protein
MPKRSSEQRLKPLSLAPLSVDEALSALLKTPPPKAVDTPARKGTSKRKAGKKR